MWMGFIEAQVSLMRMKKMRNDEEDEDDEEGA
ncbi:hypothetical protein BFJ66_g14423 [Fusarium oxysporum f. sp. cepae]|uniref:Uncharacterized protein n=1 Tax=Fusarium oxysporum f. sp. cepae TaxID=396571 RepID=A0A3L6N2M2_FUSOX|nr:hypothetical protein BFJ65_g15047 [Fusarium oxysporum f. sp. cepae]RKK31500.1 hypothetical protein BFJ67_g15202 [Fusarium oxysporum f. sp. cepae]RKK34426.1 hypothetical protein BFJ66_g14423 [Fusarium oxysporum f. sp. cepae]